MIDFREMKRQARRQLHEHLSEPALYLTDPYADPLGCTVRLHLRFDELGELLRGGFSDRQEITPRIVFMGDQVRPKRGAIVVTKDMGAWRIDNDLPPDDITITAEVVRVTPSQAESYGWNPEMQFMGLAAIADSVNPNFPPQIAIVTKGEKGDPGEPGPRGQEGKSAYQVWLDQGNTGTEHDFLEAIGGAVWKEKNW